MIKGGCIICGSEEVPNIIGLDGTQFCSDHSRKDLSMAEELEILLDKSFGEDMDMSLLDGDSRGMKQRFRDLFSSMERKKR